ncbi:SEL1-like repeat protein [Helicobacter sp. MIT 01-3238]|uniref:SEL1-like repeat protein n=1 Tax=Helicobacter sp. MIT 01-3238 TaxID=398627 RepID=UPI000E1ED0CD|nr:SEL1-like repeat protein [Helicobacter sp. MIT 01-3238]RDU51796.1 hypothetical protein CQA40_09085 [Helicobacter sp. MIT 01-3238]
MNFYHLLKYSCKSYFVNFSYFTFALFWLISLFLLASFETLYADENRHQKQLDNPTLLESTDIESLLKNSADSLLSKKFIKKLESKKVIAISNIQNTTKEQLDIESIMVIFKSYILDSEKFIFTNTIPSNANKIDTMIKDSRKLRKDAEYNQYTTKEEGSLLAPDYSLWGKISKKIKPQTKEVEYEILLRLTDLTTGVEVWSNISKISKTLPKNMIENYKKEFTFDTQVKMSQKQWKENYEKCLTEDINACQKLIQNGVPSTNDCNKESCNKIGLIMRNIGRIDEAFDYHKRAIDLENYEGYRYLGILYESYKKDSTNAIKTYKIACDKYKEKESCGLLGSMYAKGDNIAQDSEKVIHYYKRACDLGSSIFCVFIGMMYDYGKAVKRDLVMAKHYFQKACDIDNEFCTMKPQYETIEQAAKQEWDDCIKYKNPSVCKRIIDSGVFPSADKCNDGQSCNDIGVIHKIAGLPKQAIPYYEKAISLGSTRSYFNLGLLYEQINQKEQAKKYYKPACDKGIYEACYGLGNLFLEEQDFFNARKNFEIVCDKSSSDFSGDSCNNLGAMYVNGYGVRQDYDKAFEYHKKSCELSSPEGCGNLGHLYETIKQDKNKAKQYYGKACDLGSQKACQYYKSLNNQKIH